MKDVCRNYFACGWLMIGMLLVSSSLLSEAAMAIPQDNGVVWYTDLDEAKKKSRISRLPILIKFEADWCQPCQLLSQELKKAQIVRSLEQVVPVVVDIDKQEELAKQFDVTSIPKVILINDEETVLADKTGFAPVEEWKAWIVDSLKDTEFSMPEELASFDPPTSTEVEELLLRLKAKDAAMRELAMERLISFPTKTRKPVVEVLTGAKTPKAKKKKKNKKPSLAQQLAVLEVLKRWGAPTDGIDPWTPASFTEQRLNTIQAWIITPIEELNQKIGELSEADLLLASTEIDQLLTGRSVKAGLSRLTRYGDALLPQVYERLKSANSDEQVSRLTALRYWLTASNQLRLGWSGGLIELAGRDAETRRSAAAMLVQLAGKHDQALLMELFADPDPLVRELALKGLNGLGSDTEQAMVRLLKDPDPNVRAAVLKQFAESKTTSAVDAVAEYLKTETDSGLVVQAIRFMREAGGNTAIDSIVPFTNHESWQVRAELAESLGKIDEDDLSTEKKTVRVTGIVELMSDEDSFVAVKASESMPKTNDLKLIKRLVGIASKKPDIAETIIESLVPSSYDEDAVDVSNFLLDFMDSEHASVRRGALKGLQKTYKSKIDNAILTKMIKDPDEKNRILGMLAFVKRLSSIRPGMTEKTAEILRTSRPINRSSPSLFSRMFGSGSKSTPSAPGLDLELELEEIPSEDSAESEDAEPAKDMDKKQDDETLEKSESKEEPKTKPKEEIQESEMEQWLTKFVSGEIKDTKFKESSQAIRQALDVATSEEEKFTAGVALAAYGENERILGLAKSATSDEMKRQLAGLLIWVPFESRVQLVNTIVTPETSEAELDMVVNSFASVSNPRGASVFWKLAKHPNIDINTIHRAFYELVFDGSENYYNVQPIKNHNKKPANLLVASIPDTDELGENGTFLALVLLNHIDQTKAKELAATVINGDHSAKNKHIAARVMLRTEKYTVDRWGNRSANSDRSHAVEFLKSKDTVQVVLALKYIAFGENTLNQDQNGDQRFQIVSNSYSHSTAGRKAGTAKVFDPPKGMTESMLDLEGIELDEESNAYVTYFRSLFNEKADLKALIDYHNLHPENEQLNRLVYRAIAATNNDNLIHVVEKIYQYNTDQYDNDSDHADLYWTIRPMDGENALRLRKRIRDAEGISNLNHY